MQMSFQEYDEVMEKFEKMSERVYWPTKNQLDMFEQEPEKWLMFCLFLHENNPQPVTEEEKESKKGMMKFINHELELIDDE